MHCATLNNRVINAVKSSFISFEFFHVARCNISVLIHDEVQYALQNHIPVVALESTIISHGLPYPKNLTVAREIASTIRNNGAIPAMCAVVRGVPKVGLDEDDIKILAQGASSGGQDVHKLSRRDLAYACATSKNGSTTVTTTMILAHHAGIKTFATGGIGGVHRDWSTTLDVSADLMELSRTPVTVVCSGVKAILDVPKTLEQLETLGVPVVSYQSKSFPTFYSDHSSYKAPFTLYAPTEVAQLMFASSALQLSAGMVVAVPPPTPIPHEVIERAIEEGLRLARDRRVTGAAFTPFLLATVQRLTGGLALDANVDLVINNARVAAEIAVAYSNLTAPHKYPLSSTSSLSTAAAQSAKEAIRPTDPKANPSSRSSRSLVRPVWVVGASNVDHVASPHPLPSHDIVKGSSVPGTVSTSYGGVARNIAEQLAMLGVVNVSLVSVVGDDAAGIALKSHAMSLDIDVSEVLTAPRTRSCSYVAVHRQDGDLVAAVADTEALKRLTADAVQAAVTRLLAGQSPRRDAILVCDGNISEKSLLALATAAQHACLPLVFEPTSVVKSVLPLRAKVLPLVDVLTPNDKEISAMVQAMRRETLEESSYIDAAELEGTDYEPPNRNGTIEVMKQAIRVLLAMTALPLWQAPYSSISGRDWDKHVIVTMGARGVLWCRWEAPREDVSEHGSLSKRLRVACTEYSALPLPLGTEIRSTNGAGDAFVAGLLSEMAASSGRLVNENCIHAGLRAARDVLLRQSRVP